MGVQYYFPIILKDDLSIEGFIHPHHYNSGLKLMEHSYVGNEVVSLVACLLNLEPRPLVWAGDYADNAEDYYFACHSENDLKKEFDWGDGGGLGKADEIVNNNPFFINHEKKQWFDIRKQTVGAQKYSRLCIHPLPILTADGNSRGDGDYYGVLMNLVGTWAYDTIEVSSNAPMDEYTEIEPWFTEE